MSARQAAASKLPRPRRERDHGDRSSRHAREHARKATTTQPPHGAHAPATRGAGRLASHGGGARGRGQGGASGVAARRRTASGSRRAGRRDPVELLEEQAASRVPELVPIRYGRMLVSPFTFYRGAAYLMAADLAGAPADGPGGAALRRRAPVELRRVRRARPAADLQHQRLRRDAAGPVRVGRQAARRELRRRRPRPGLRREAAAVGQPDGDARPTGRRSGASPGCRTSTSGTPASTWTRSARWSRSR